MTFDPVAYKQAITQEWERAAQGWHRWIPMINAWLEEATETMLDQTKIKEGSRVIDIAAGDGGQSVAAAQRVGSSGEVLATDIAPEFENLANAVASKTGLTQLRAEVMDHGRNRSTKGSGNHKAKISYTMPLQCAVLLDQANGKGKRSDLQT